MSYTKHQFVQGAFEELGLADYVFDLSSDEMRSGLRRLDAMMAEWNGSGIRLGYPLVSSPENSVLTAETGVPDSANEAIITNLAIRLAPQFGKTVSPYTMVAASKAYKTLVSLSAQPIEMKTPNTLPKGAGWKDWRNNNDPFIVPKQSGPEIGPDYFLELD